MKPLIHFLIVITTLSNSCGNQELNETIIKYSAQTRGFMYSLNFEKNVLEVNKNDKIYNVVLNKKQVRKINSLLENIDFNEIENNISIDDLALDKTIKGELKVSLKEKVFHFELDHNNLPDNIKNLFKQLEASIN